MPKKGYSLLVRNEILHDEQLSAMILDESVSIWNADNLEVTHILIYQLLL